ncbi:hypothetical protein SPFM10_00031 [Salmonella phage SPFM10]|nr:hypothetical protein SPFM10_00031 [Salmonella phage SPFM10]
MAIHNHTVEKEISVTGIRQYNQEIFPKDVLGAVASSQKIERLVTDEAWAENTTDQIKTYGEGLTIDPKKLEVKAEPKFLNESSKRFVNLPNPYNPKVIKQEVERLAEAGRVTAKAYPKEDVKPTTIVVERTIPHDAVDDTLNDHEFDEKEDLVIEAPSKPEESLDIVDDEATQSDNAPEGDERVHLGEDDDAVETVALTTVMTTPPSTDYEDDEFVMRKSAGGRLTDVQMGRMFYRNFIFTHNGGFTSMNMGVIERNGDQQATLFDGMDMNQLSRVKLERFKDFNLLWLLELFGWVCNVLPSFDRFKMTYNDRVKTNQMKTDSREYMRQNYYIIELDPDTLMSWYERLHNIQLLITSSDPKVLLIENYTPMLPHYFFFQYHRNNRRIRRMIEDGVVPEDGIIGHPRKKPVVGQERQTTPCFGQLEKPAMIRHHFQLPRGSIYHTIDLDQVVLAPPLMRKTDEFGRPRIIPLEKLQLQ